MGVVINKSDFECVFLLGTAFLAKRFSDTSYSGSILSSGLGSMGICLYNDAFCQSEHSKLVTMIGKTGILASTNCAAWGIAKCLKDRGVLLPLSSCLKLGAIQLVGSSLFTLSSTQVENPPHDEPTIIREEYQKYLLSPRKWQRLSKEEKKEKIKAFIDAGIPPFPFSGDRKLDIYSQWGDLPNPNYYDSHTDTEHRWSLGLFGKYDSHEQISHESVRREIYYWPPKIDGHHTPSELDQIRAVLEHFPYYRKSLYEDGKLQTVLPNGLPEEPSYDISLQQFFNLSPFEQKHYIRHFKKSDRWNEMPNAIRTFYLKRYAVADPVTRKEISKQLTDGMKTTWMNEEGLTPEEITTASKRQIRLYFFSIIQQDPLFEGFTTEQQEAFIPRFYKDPTLLKIALEQLSVEKVGHLERPILQMFCDMLPLMNDGDWSTVVNQRILAARSLFNDRIPTSYEINYPVATALRKRFTDENITSPYAPLLGNIYKKNLTKEAVENLSPETLSLYFDLLLHGGKDLEKILDPEALEALQNALKEKGIVAQKILEKKVAYIEKRKTADILIELIFDEILSNPNAFEFIPEEDLRDLLTHSNSSKALLRMINFDTISTETLHKLPGIWFREYPDPLTPDQLRQLSPQQQRSLPTH